MSLESNQLKPAGRFIRVVARALGLVFDNPAWCLLFLGVAMSGVKGPNPVGSVLLCVFWTACIGGYFYLARLGMTPVKALFGLQVVSSETGKPVGFLKMYFRDMTTYITSGLAFAYFGLLMMSMFRPSTANNRVEQSFENAERAAATAVAVGSAVAVFKTDAMFKHDNWFKTAVVNRSYAEIKNQLSKPKEQVLNPAHNKQESSRAA